MLRSLVGSEMCIRDRYGLGRPKSERIETPPYILRASPYAHKCYEGIRRYARHIHAQPSWAIPASGKAGSPHEHKCQVGMRPNPVFLKPSSILLNPPPTLLHLLACLLHQRKSIENLSKIYRTSIENRSKIDRTSIEHLSNIYRKSIENLSISSHMKPNEEFLIANDREFHAVEA